MNSPAAINVHFTEGVGHIEVRTAEVDLRIERSADGDRVQRLELLQPEMRAMPEGRDRSGQAADEHRKCGRCDARAEFAAVTVEGARLDVRDASKWGRIVAQRKDACAECSLATRWSGLWWCGVPAPLRWLRRSEGRGCGCCLSVKWHLARTPGTLARGAWAWLMGHVAGIEWNGGTELNRCPLGRWKRPSSGV